MENLLRIVFMVIGLIIGFILTMLVVSNLADEIAMDYRKYIDVSIQDKHKIINYGCAEYNKTTGEFQWILKETK